MVLVPLVAALEWFGLAERVPLLVYNFDGFVVGTLQYSYVTWIYAYLAFCIGVVLFFSKERGRRRHRLDWTRRWGVINSYVVLLLGVPYFALVTALVMIGVAALFMSLPPANQPAVTDLLARLSAGYITYGPHDSDAAIAALAASSASAVLLACVPIYEALRRTGPKALALVMLAPLALASVWCIGGAALYILNPTRNLPAVFFFQPELLPPGLSDLGTGMGGRHVLTVSRTWEVAKWLAILGVAIWLSLAQARAWRKSPSREPDAP